MFGVIQSPEDPDYRLEVCDHRLEACDHRLEVSDRPVIFFQSTDWNFQIDRFSFLNRKRVTEKFLHDRGKAPETQNPWIIFRV